MTHETTACDLTTYDDVEVQPVIAEDHYCEPLPYSEKDKASFWSVYVHLKTGGVDALVDCVDEQNAEVCASVLRIALHALEVLKLAQRALNAAPRFRVDDTDSYAIASRIETVFKA